MSKYKVGDKVTIRQWDDMKKEFGLNTLGIIACKAKFTNSMREFCGKTIVIDEVLHSGNYMIKMLIGYGLMICLSQLRT